MENFVKTIPEGYEEVYHINATDKKTGVWLTLASLAVALIFGVICVFLPFIPGVSFLSRSELLVEDYDFLIFDGLLIFGMVAYVILHELTHGIVYKCMTKQRLTFGLRWSCAFCGVPDIYTSRRVALTSLCMPTVVFSILFIGMMIAGLIAFPVLYIYAAILFVIHISGCVGDLYMIALLLLRFREKQLYMRDTGPEQWIYVKK